MISHRGAVRGYSLARPADTIRVREILEAIEGQGVFEQCVFWPAKCSQQRHAPQPCLARSVDLVDGLASRV